MSLFWDIYYIHCLDTGHCLFYSYTDTESTESRHLSQLELGFVWRFEPPAVNTSSQADCSPFTAASLQNSLYKPADSSQLWL